MQVLEVLVESLKRLDEIGGTNELPPLHRAAQLVDGVADHVQALQRRDRAGQVRLGGVKHAYVGAHIVHELLTGGSLALDRLALRKQVLHGVTSVVERQTSALSFASRPLHIRVTTRKCTTT